ncbi:MAG: signal recognition particle-docking protein FtsY [Sulfobacillus benefaciens]|uniref:Signal recognition particle receptor FtsY n=1 Tax=Sulfobacillus benefaciens TaxID=453960 RepID=A0A2T2XJG0_9FIRM|nr:MAG: signal recognition particle-docking protein FtsY [Sulfobacillus benefaciens]
MANFWERLKQGMTRTRMGLGGRLRTLFTGREWHDDLWDDLEEVLYEADLGSGTIEYLLDQLRKRVQKERPKTADQVLQQLFEVMVSELGEPSPTLALDPGGPWVWLMVGVNGTGKTTTAGKFAYLLQQQHKTVILGAADTFRAAAVEQLVEWGRRAGVEVVHQASGADPAAVAYDTLRAARARGADLAIIDTAGRLQNKVNLMLELQKIRRVVEREYPGAPHEVWLVIDATTGQNGLSQARIFMDSVKVTGIVLTKLDGTAKGGIALSIYHELGIPIRYVGVGETAQDLLPFNPHDYVRAILGEENETVP